MTAARYDADDGRIRVQTPMTVDTWVPLSAEPLRTVSSSFRNAGWLVDPNSGHGVIAGSTRDRTRISITSLWNETFQELKPLPFRTRGYDMSPTGSLVALWRTGDGERVCIYSTAAAKCVFDAPSSRSNVGANAWFVDSRRAFAYRDEYDDVRVARLVRQLTDSSLGQATSGPDEPPLWSETCETDTELGGRDAVVLRLPESEDAQVLGFSADATEIFALEEDFESDVSRSI